MKSSDLAEVFRDLSTPHVADACLRRKVPVRCAPSGIQALTAAGCHVVGRALPARHYGSVDVFLEALESASPGDILVVDNAGRMDEACVGDLIALEARQAGIAGIVIWGLHRDTPELIEIGLPVFSLGATPTGPLRLDPRETEALVSARVGAWTLTRDDLVMADENGVLFVPASMALELAEMARGVRETEHRQADAMRQGISLRTQLQFSGYLAGRASDSSLTFRKHLRQLGGAVEE